MAVLYKSIRSKYDSRKGKIPIKTIPINLEQELSRPMPNLEHKKSRNKYIKSVESLIRKSPAYKNLIRFIKTHMEGNKCAILQGISNGNGKRYSIQIHHEPFSLYQLVNVEIAKREYLGQEINQFEIANSVMEYHYDGLVGLIPLSATMHDLVTNGKLFIPVNWIYQDFNKYYLMNQEWLPDSTTKIIDTKIQMTLRCGEIQSNVIEPEFIYLEVDGWKFPQVPDSWGEKLESIRLEEITEEEDNNNSKITTEEVIES